MKTIMDSKDGVHYKEEKINTDQPRRLISSWQIFWKNPYLMRLVFSVGFGALIIGYDMGVIYSGYLYLHPEKQDQNSIEIAETAIVCPSLLAAIGALSGGWTISLFGDNSKSIILTSDVLLMMGAFISILHVEVVAVGRIFVVIGIGMASISSPLYISEVSPARIRGALVSTIPLLAALGHLLSYPICLLASKAPGTWRWMVVVTGVLALVHFRLVRSLPQSPRSLYRQDKIKEAVDILKKLNPPGEAENELKALQLSVELAEIAVNDQDLKGRLMKNDWDVLAAFDNVVARRGFIIVAGCHVAQQLVGINMVIFYSPMILRLDSTLDYDVDVAIRALPLIISGLSAIGSIISMLFVDKVGRRRLLLISMLGSIACLGLLSHVIFEATTASSSSSSSSSIDRIIIDPATSNMINKTISTPTSSHHHHHPIDQYLDHKDVRLWMINKTSSASAWCSNVQCSECLDPHAKYSFIYYDAFMDQNVTNYKASARRANDNNDGWDKKGGSMTTTTTSNLRLFSTASVGLGLYIIFYSLGMGTIPWIINSEIYPARYRAICGGFGEYVKCLLNGFMVYVLLKLNKELGSDHVVHIFLLFSLVSGLAILFIYLFLPETKGLLIEEIEYVMLMKNNHKRRDTLERMEWRPETLEDLRMPLLPV